MANMLMSRFGSISNAAIGLSIGSSFAKHEAEATMTRAFCTRGEREGLKGSVHAAGVVLAGVMAVYNMAAWWYRREQHLGINAVVYSLAVLWEIKQTAHHVARGDADAQAAPPLSRLLHFAKAAA